MKWILDTIRTAKAVFRNIPLFLELDRLDEEGEGNSPRAHHLRETIRRDLSIHHCLR